jgi:precorrin-2/cobalt-factor-2 C20-methyltransferase
MSAGRLIGVGVGPGAPDLLTLRAVAVLRAAPVVAYPALAGQPSLARAIAAPHLPPGAMEEIVAVPMTPERAPAQAAYDEGAVRLAAHLAAGRDVALLCEGDPLFYGSFMYLAARLAPRFPVEVVPGVTSVSAAAALARLPLGAREGRIAVLPATLPDDSLRAGILGAETAAVMKLGRHWPRLRALVEAMGLASRATFVARAGLPGEAVLPFPEAPPEAPYFSLLLIAREADPWT